MKIKGGDKLEAALDEIAKNIKKAASVHVGFLEGATYPGGMPVAAIAAIQEFGAPKAGIPPRPFFRTMIEAKSVEWPKAIAGLLKANDYDARKTLDIAGEAIEGQLRESIIDVNEPALSPVTLMLRKMRSEDQSLVVTGTTVAEARKRVADGESTDGVSTKPLDDTGHLIASVGHEVKE